MNQNLALPAIGRSPLKPLKGGKGQTENELRIGSLNYFFNYENTGLPSRLSALEIFWISDGSGTLEVGGNEYALETGMVYCVSPGQWCLINKNEDLDGYYIRISNELLHDNGPATYSNLFSGSMTSRNLLMLPVDSSMKLAEEILLKMRTLLYDPVSPDNEILKGYLHLFILYISRSTAVPVEDRVYSRENEIVSQFLYLIREKYIRQKMVAEYAAELFVTAAYLNRIVKKVSGHTASHHIQQFIILEAKRLCRNTRKSMKEIAYGLGFNDIAHFSKFFKNYTGKNFTSFKREVMEENLYAGLPSMND